MIEKPQRQGKRDMMTRQIIDGLLNKAITRPVGKMSNAEVDKYLRRKDRENDSIEAPASVPKMSSEEGKVRALDEKRAIKLERQGKSMNEDLVKSIDALMEKAKIDKLVDQFSFEGDKGHETGDYVKRQIRSGRKRTADSDPLTTPISQRYGRGDDNKYDKSLTESMDALLEKAKLTVEQDRTGHGTDTESQFKDDAGDAGPVKTYRNRPKTGDVEVFEQRTPWPSSDKKKNRKVIPANAAHEKELKNASMTTIIDELLEKAVYGVGTRGGKIEPPGTGKNPKNHGKVSRPTLSKEQQEKILRTSQEKASRT